MISFCSQLVCWRMFLVREAVIRARVASFCILCLKPGLSDKLPMTIHDHGATAKILMRVTID